MEFQTLTLVDSGYLYLGLAVQQIVRASGSLMGISVTIVVCCLLWMALRMVTSPEPQPFMGIVAYFIQTSIIMVLFWPEAVGPITQTVLQAVEPEDVTSLACHVDEQNGNGGSDPEFKKDARGFMQTAGMTVAAGIEVPVMFGLILSAVTETPLVLGEAINGNFARPFEKQFAFQALMEVSVGEKPVGNAFDLFTDAEGCLPEAMRRFAERAAAATPPIEVTADSVQPWTQNMTNILEEIQLHAGKLPRPFDHALFQATRECHGGTCHYNCKRLYEEVIVEGIRTLVLTKRTKQGQPLGQALMDSTQLSEDDLVKFLVQRENKRRLEKTLESENLQKLLVRGGAVLGAQAALAGVDGAVEGAKVGGKVGALLGFVKSLGSMLAGTVRVEIENLLAFMRPAIIMLMFTPYITGILSATAIGLFPFVVLWSLFPGQHFKPLMNYVLVLLFAHSAPLWFAISDLLADAAFNNFGGGGSFQDASSTMEFFQGHAAGLLVAVLSVFMVPAVQALVLFGSWKAVSGLFAGR